MHEDCGCSSCSACARDFTEMWSSVVQALMVGHALRFVDENHPQPREATTRKAPVFVFHDTLSKAYRGTNADLAWLEQARTHDYCVHNECVNNRGAVVAAGQRQPCLLLWYRYKGHCPWYFVRLTSGLMTWIWAGCKNAVEGYPCAFLPHQGLLVFHSLD
jgi:hypothetical protein